MISRIKKSTSNLKDNSYGELNNNLQKLRTINLTSSRLSDFYRLISIKEEDYLNTDDLIFEIFEENNLKKYKTGNWVGSFKIDKKLITISSRFGNKFLGRMLNFLDDIYLDEEDPLNGEIKFDNNFQFILVFLFTKALEKAVLNGLPSVYHYKKENSNKFRGKIDINNYLKKDIPFKGKLSNIHRESRVVTEIIDVLLHAQMIIQNKYQKSILPRISSVLKENSKFSYSNLEMRQRALKHCTLMNPMYKNYKKALKWASHIIDNYSMESNDKNSENKSLGFLFNIAELFEIYLLKILKLHFTEWKVQSPKIEVYNDKFYSRKIIPDIVMTKGNYVAIFDVKYKNMNYMGRNQYGLGDLDRTDFFQINTYMSYYKNKGFNVVVGGLLYPLNSLKTEFDKNKCHSEKWLENPATKFIVDGIEIPSEENNDWILELIRNEKLFIKRISNVLESK